MTATQRKHKEPKDPADPTSTTVGGPNPIGIGTMGLFAQSDPISAERGAHQDRAAVVTKLVTDGPTDAMDIVVFRNSDDNQSLDPTYPVYAAPLGSSDHIAVGSWRPLE